MCSILNRKTMNIILILVAIPMILGLGLFILPTSENSIKVSIPLKGSIQNYKSLLIQAKCTPTSLGFDDLVIKGDVRDWARKNGIEPISLNLTKKGSRLTDVLVRVEATASRGFPYIGKHFSIEWWHYSRIRIGFVDPHTDEIIGEAQYDRPFFKNAPRQVFELMLDSISRKQYGLTDFSAWERRQFEKSKISIDLPIGFSGYADEALSKKLEWYTTVLTLHFHDIKKENRISSGLYIFFDEMTPEKFSRMKEKARSAQDKKTMDYVHWLSEFHDEVTKRDELPQNGPFTTYIKDYRNREGRMIRAKASLNNKLRPGGPAKDEKAIMHMLNSVEVQ